MPKYLQSVVICAKNRCRIPKFTTFEVALLEVLNQTISHFVIQGMGSQNRGPNLKNAEFAVFTECSCK